MKIRKLVKCIGLIPFFGVIITACSSSDDNDKKAKPDQAVFINPKGDWKLTLNYENNTRVYTFSTNEEGISTNAYGPFKKIELSAMHNAIRMTNAWIWDYRGDNNVAIDLRTSLTHVYFDVLHPEANAFRAKVHYNYVKDSASTCYVTLERTSKSDHPNPENLQ